MANHKASVKSSKYKMKTDVQRVNEMQYLEVEEPDIEVPGYSIDELIEELELLKSSSGCDSLEEYKQKIQNREIINFSHGQLKMWEELERHLYELEVSNLDEL